MVSICCFTPLGNTILWSFSRGLILFFSHFVRFHSRIVLILFIGVAQVGIRSPSSKETILATQCWPSRGDTCMNCFFMFGRFTCCFLHELVCGLGFAPTSSRRNRNEFQFTMLLGGTWWVCVAQGFPWFSKVLSILWVSGGLPEVSLYCAGFPCQPYSLLSSTRRMLADGNARQLFKVIKRIRRYRPKVTWCF